ncbi:MAG: glycosyltransferase, partial [Longimicrobiales bacterium]|nr:glycosyltransferase [Longimicrobiales bacterium]
MKGEQGPLSIAHLLAPAPYGGLETVVVTLSRAQVALGARVTVVLVVTPDENDESGHPVARALEGSGAIVETWVLPVRAYREERHRVVDLLRRNSIDVLHTHGYRPDVMDASVARKEGVATVSTVHGRVGGTWKGRLYEWVQARALRRFDGVIAVSEKLQNELTRDGVARDRVHLLPNAWAPREELLSRSRAREELGLPEGPSVIGWVGRMGQEKAPDVFCQAAAEASHGTAHFSIIGDGPLRRECESLVDEAGL